MAEMNRQIDGQVHTDNEDPVFLLLEGLALASPGVGEKKGNKMK